MYLVSTRHLLAFFFFLILIFLINDLRCSQMKSIFFSSFFSFPRFDWVLLTVFCLCIYGNVCICMLWKIAFGWDHNCFFSLFFLFCISGEIFISNTMQSNARIDRISFHEEWRKTCLVLRIIFINIIHSINSSYWNFNRNRKIKNIYKKQHQQHFLIWWDTLISRTFGLEWKIRRKQKIPVWYNNNNVIFPLDSFSQLYFLVSIQFAQLESGKWEK